jgi:hypothetical protein
MVIKDTQHKKNVFIFSIHNVYMVMQNIPYNLFLAYFFYNTLVFSRFAMSHWLQNILLENKAWNLRIFVRKNVKKCEKMQKNAKNA